MSVLENSAEKKTPVAKCKEITGPCRKFLSERSFVVFTPGQVLFGWSNEDEVDGARSMFLGKGGMAHTGFCGETLRGRDHFEDLDVYRSIILKWILKK